MFRQTFQLLGLVIGLSVCSASVFAEAGWQTLKDKTGSCQLSVPANWFLSQAGHAASPENMGTTVIEGRVAYHPFHFSPGELKVLNIDTVFENSAQRVFLRRQVRVHSSVVDLSCRGTRPVRTSVLQRSQQLRRTRKMK